MPADIIPHFYSSVGMIVVNWSFVENNLDAWSALVYHDHGGSSIERKLPKPISRKIKFLEKCFGALQTLTHVRDEAASYISRVKALSKIRNFVVHGVLSEFDPSDASFTFLRVDTDPEKKQHVLERLKILGTDLVHAGIELSELAKTGQGVTAKLLDASEQANREPQP